MKFTRPLRFAVLAVGLLGALGLRSASQAAPPVVMGYYPSYRSVPSPATLRYDRFTHIIRSFLTADASGKLTIPVEFSDPSLVTQAHAKGVKVLFALGGGANGKEFGSMARSPEESAQFIAAAVKFMTDSNADGLAVDWELPEATDQDVAVDFIGRLRSQMKAVQPKSLLVLVVSAIPNNSHGYDGPRLRDNVDYLNIMAYDFHGPWSHAGHHTNLYEDKNDAVDGKIFSYPASLAYWRDVQGFSPAQIVFGIAGYGRGFKVKEWGEKPTSDSQYPEISFSAARSLIGHGWSRQWDAETHAPWLLSDDKSDRISYDDEQSVADKARWMKANGLPGFFIWELSQEYVDGDNVLTAAGRKAWGRVPGGK